MEGAQQGIFPLIKNFSPLLSLSLMPLPPNNFLSNCSIVPSHPNNHSTSRTPITSSSPPVHCTGLFNWTGPGALVFLFKRRWLHSTSWIIRVRMSSCSLLGQNCDSRFDPLTASLQKFQIWRQKPPTRVNWGYPWCRMTVENRKHPPHTDQRTPPWKEGMKGNLSINSHQFKVYRVPVNNCCDILK